MSKIKAKNIDLTDTFTFTGTIEVPTPSTGNSIVSKQYVDTADNGLQGSKGLQGNTNVNGFQGNMGTQGNTGLQGFRGIQGIIGTSGITGAPNTISPPPNNILINGGMDFLQRGDPTSLTAMSTGYHLDRWRYLTENSQMGFQRFTGDSVFPSSRYYGHFIKQLNNGKFLFYQIIEARDTHILKNRTVLFQMKIKSSTSRDFRMALLSHTGTADNVVSPAFTSMNSANGTDPSKGSNISNITVDSALNSTSANNGITGVTCAVTTTINTYGMTATVPSTANNLIFAIWADDDLITNETFQLGEIGAYADVTSLQPWNPRTYQQELALCQRYFEKSYNIDVYVTGGTTNEGSYEFIAQGGSNQRAVQFKVTKRIAPTVTFYSSTSSSGNFRNVTTSNNSGVASEGVGMNNMGIYLTGSGGTVTAGDLMRGHYLLDSEL